MLPSCARWRRSMPPATRLPRWRLRHLAANKLRLQALVYYGVRERFRLSSQRVVRAIAKVSEGDTRDRTIRLTFRRHGSMPYDQRICSLPAPVRDAMERLFGAFSDNWGRDAGREVVKLGMMR